MQAQKPSGWNSVSSRKKSNRPRRGPALPTSPPSWFLELEPAQSSTKLDDDDGFVPFVLMLMGFPGSGKSTVAQKLAELFPNKYMRINQDELKTRKRCLARAKAAMQEGKCPVIDRCNSSLEHRKPFRQLAAEQGYAIDCLVLEVPRQECVSRCQARADHPTVTPQDGPKIVGCVQADWKLPQPHEKFRRVWRVNMSSKNDGHDLRQVLEDYLLA